MKRGLSHIKIAMTIMVFALLNCETKKEAVFDVNTIPEGGILLDSWHVVGPFANQEKDPEFLFIDNLSQYGLHEDSLSVERLKKVSLPDGITSINVVTNTHKIDFNKSFGFTDSTTIYGNVYAACVVNSNEAKKIKLNFSSDDGAVIWLNGKLIFSDNRIGGIKNYDYYIDLDIKEGHNDLVVKVNNVQYGWEMFAVLEEPTQQTEDRYRRTFSLEYGNYFLDRSVVDNELKVNNALPKQQYAFSVIGPGGEVLLASDSFRSEKSWDIAKLPDGLYVATMIDARGEKFDEDFYKGNLIEHVQRSIDRISLNTLSAQDADNVKALIHRYHHILKPQHKPSGISQWRDFDKKLIFIFKNLAHYIRDVDDRGSLGGGSLRTYQSKIDGGVQYYQLFVPESYKPGDMIPLMIEMPKLMNWHPSPLETYRFANIRLFELFEDLANKHNIIILDPGCRTVDKVSLNGIDEADLWEAIDDVKRNFSIDTTRIYLRGACLSSRNALRIATKYPDYFAAVSITAPQLSLTDTENVWVQQNEPLNYIRNIKGIPLLNIHSVIDPHSPIEESRKLNRIAKVNNFTNYTYRQLSYEFKTFYSEEYLEDIVSFFKSFQLNPRPKEIDFATAQIKYNKSFWITMDEIEAGRRAHIKAVVEDNAVKIETKNVISYSIDLRTLPYDPGQPVTIIENGQAVYSGSPEGDGTLHLHKKKTVGMVKTKSAEGPFAHIFSKPFMVVLGTQGDEQENKSIQLLADTLNKHWLRRYFINCPIKLDTEVTEDDLRKKSIILLGVNSNLVFNQLTDQLPVLISNNFIQIGDKRIEGNELGFYAVYPNPYNNSQYIGVIGSNKYDKMHMGREAEQGCFDVSDFGWFDYKAWSLRDTTAIAAGYFSNSWK